MAEDEIVFEETMEEGVEDAELSEMKKGASKRKGRGFEGSEAQTQHVKNYETLESEGNSGPQRSVEGWIIMVTNVHEEAQEDEVKDLFKEYGNVQNMHLNLDRRTGYFKGYAIVQYETQQEAANAIEGLKGYNFLGQDLSASWCFMAKGKESKRR